MKAAAVFASRVDVQTTLESMLAALRVREWHSSGVLRCEPGAAGYVSTSDRFGSTRLLRQAENGNWLVITGVPVVTTGSLDALLEECLHLPFETAIQRLEDLDGPFAALHWNQNLKKFAVITDVLGMQPLYMLHHAEVFAVATDAKAFTRANLTGVEMDPAAWGSFLSFKHPIAGRSLVKGIQRAPAGTVMVFDANSHELATRSYWKWPSPGITRIEEVPIRKIVDVFQAELQAYSQHHSSATVCLSGGFDSRLILAGLSELGRPPRALSVSHADELFDLDGRIAARVARLYGADLEFCESDRSYYSSPAYLDYLLTTEVSTPSLYLFIAQLCSKLKPSMEAVWDGMFPGFLLFPAHQPPGGFAAYKSRECAPPDSVWWKAAQRVFNYGLVSEMKAAFTECMQEEIGRYQDSEFGVSEFIVRNRARHRIAINPLQAYSNVVMAFNPGMSKEFLSLVASISCAVRSEHRLYRLIFQKCFPSALSVPAVSGTTVYPLNARFDASSWLARLATMANQRPKVAAAMRLAGLRPGSGHWQESTLLAASLQKVDYTHRDLSPEAEKIGAALPPYDQVTTKARELLFYWYSWRGILSGEFQPNLSL